jgi:hypothetical protein
MNWRRPEDRHRGAMNIEPGRRVKDSAFNYPLLLYLIDS